MLRNHEYQGASTVLGAVPTGWCLNWDKSQFVYKYLALKPLCLKSAFNLSYLLSTWNIPYHHA